MYDHHFKGMTSALHAEFPLISTQKIEAVLREYWADKIAVVWDVWDVVGLAAEKGLYISNRDAKNLLDEALEDHDAENGINWMFLEYYLDNYANICPECGEVVTVEMIEGDLVAHCKSCDFRVILEA